jgi:ABC-type branched-subunit amino acid transport system substrate-binding protein
MPGRWLLSDGQGGDPVTSARAAAGRPLRVGACLSLSGRYARFGRQAARGLAAWRTLDGAAELIVADDRSAAGTLESVLPGVAARSDVLLGPYSTVLTRAAGQLAAGAGWLLWNHGGSGDDVQQASPGHIVSVPAPASRYAEPFVRHLATATIGATLWITHGRGSFGKQVAAGAEALARRAGVGTMHGDHEAALPPADLTGPWDLFCAGSFEEDVGLIRRARASARPPRLMCAVAAGVRDFAGAAGNAEGVFGVGQWFPGAAQAPDLGPAEADFLAGYSALVGALPDYPAAQAAAAAVLAAHCARQAAGTARDLLWPAALALNTRTLFGDFRIRPGDGAQIGHTTVCVRWTAGRPSGPVRV